MTEKKSSFKKRVVAVTCVGVFALLPVAYIVGAQGAQQRERERAPVFTDPIVGAWNCTIPPAGGAPAFNDIKNIHVGGTQSEIDDPTHRRLTRNHGTRMATSSAHFTTWVRCLSTLP
jgi:hypothetical protein